MYKGHAKLDKFTIYSLSRDLLELNDIKPDLVIDFGSRHGESIDELAPFCPSGCNFVFVEPVPKCVKLIEKRIAETELDLKFKVIPAVFGRDHGTIKFHIFETDNDQSANAFTNRGGRYGDAGQITVPVIPYGTLDVMYPDLQIDFAKVNIEGSEYGLIEDGFFKQRIKSFVMEVHNHHVENRTWKNAVECLCDDFDLVTYGNLDSKYCLMTGIRCE
jgi:FkbM family methyltransferase